MKIGIISSFSNRKIKWEIIEFIKSKNIQVLDCNRIICFCTNKSTNNLASKISKKEIDLGIFIDNYGIAPFIKANKYSDVICASVYDDFSAKMSREHNNANFLSFGSKINSKEEIKVFLRDYFSGHFNGGRHSQRVDMLMKISKGEK